MIIFLIISVLLHELGHCLVALYKECTIDRILLTPVGGLAQMKAPEPLSPKDECQVAMAGPLVSLGLSILFGAISFGIYYLSLHPRAFQFAFWISISNAVLFLFNLAPAFPLDGGRVFTCLADRKNGPLGSNAAGEKDCSNYRVRVFCDRMDIREQITYDYRLLHILRIRV